MYELFPKWLNRFSFKIEDEYETMLLSEEDTNPDNVRFVDSLGITTGSKILIDNKEYIVKDFQLYSDMNIEDGHENIPYGYGFDLHVIVEEV
jgi:hypothetical protein